MLFLHNTSWVEDEPYPNLLQEKAGRVSFPTILFLNDRGDVLGRPKARTIAAFEETLRSLHDLSDLRGKVSYGDKNARVDVLIAELGVGNLTLDQARKRVDELGQLPNEKAARVDELMTSLEVTTLSREARDEPKKTAASERFVEMFKAGRIPKDDAARVFWSYLMTHAESKGQTELFEKALEKLKERSGKDASMQRAIQTYEAKLAKMKEAR